MNKDYMVAPWLWKIHKAARYIRLFGPLATIAKIRAQYHMTADSNWGDRVVAPNPRCRAPEDRDRCIAIIGCGKFSYSVIARYLKSQNGAFLRATLDTNLARAISLAKRYDGAYATTQLKTILEDPQVRLVFIASNHATHSDYAVQCIEAGKAVHIEKPHAVTAEQLHNLTRTMARRPEIPVFLGFNRPKSTHFARIIEAISKEGGPLSINWFIAGHEIDETHWYFSPEEGGRILGNLCHWLDASIHLVGMHRFFPCRITPGSDPKSKNNFSVSIQCADGSLIVVCFSAKGHTFEGVREVLSVQRGSTLILLRDFEETRIDMGRRRLRYRTVWREHGHVENVRNSYSAVTGHNAQGESLAYVFASGMLTIGVRQSVESGAEVTLELPVDMRNAQHKDHSNSGEQADAWR